MTLAELIEPIDLVHAEALRLTREFNRMFQEAKERAAQWEPSPYPH